MKEMLLLMLLIVCINQCVSQVGFPKQFQATLNISGYTSWRTTTLGVQQLLYDYNNLRVRFDVEAYQTKHNETYMIIYKPKGAEADSPASHGYAMFNLNPNYPPLTKNNCWYAADRMGAKGPFPSKWFYAPQSQYYTEILPWFPLPSNLIKKGEEWIPELQQYATRYDSPKICDLQQTGIGKVPCLSYFETKDRPVKTIEAYGARPLSYESDEYVVTIYLSFTYGIPSEAEHLFDLPNQWPSYCGNANTGFDLSSGYVHAFSSGSQDNFTIKLQTPPVHALGDQVKIEFKLEPSWYYNGTQCAEFDPIVFDTENWDEPKKVGMTFTDYGCCNYLITATGGGYDWQYSEQTFVVYGCDGQPGSGCKDGKYPCGA